MKEEEEEKEKKKRTNEGGEGRENAECWQQDRSSLTLNKMKADNMGTSHTEMVHQSKVGTPEGQLKC